MHNGLVKIDGGFYKQLVAIEVEVENPVIGEVYPIISNTGYFTDPGTPKHIYILSDEDIKASGNVDDWVFYCHPKHDIINDGMITQLKDLNYSLEDKAYEIRHTEGWGVREGYKKILAATDPRLGVPGLSDTSVLEYVNKFGCNGAVNKIFARCSYKINKSMGHFNQFREYFLKVLSDNNIDIKFES